MSSSNATSPEQQLQALAARNAELEARNEELTQQLDWLRRQLFGAKSERRVVEAHPDQPLLSGFEAEGDRASSPVKTETVSYTRRRGGKRRDEDCVSESGLRFDESVPVEVIELGLPEGVEGSAYEVIGQKVTHRLAQRPASYVVLKYIRPVVKRITDGAIATLPAPDGLWTGSVADVSVVAGVMVDKLCYHLPLYRQHQRLAMSGITLSRSTLSEWVTKASELLEPIYAAQLRHMLQSRVLAIDETSTRAGRVKKAGARGKMNTGWYWPIYGEADEVAFTFSPTKARAHLDTVLEGFTGTLLSDGAAAYARFAQKRPELIHAQCWSHTRRMFVKAQALEPEAVGEALELIGALYAVEKHIRANQLQGERALGYRTEHALPGVDAFFAWVDAQCQRMELTPTNPLSKALAYAREREGALRVYLSDPNVAIDTNHLERALRPIPMGKKNWMFSWSEVGAKHLGIVQSLLTTCRLHEVNPYTYLVDVLQRIAIHPDRDIEQLTPRRWKQLFAHEPLVSDLQLVTRSR